MNTITFHCPETGQQLTGEVGQSGFVGEQHWREVVVDGVDWLVPQGWPNNATPICRELDPEAYAEVARRLHRPVVSVDANGEIRWQ